MENFSTGENPHRLLRFKYSRLIILLYTISSEQATFTHVIFVFAGLIEYKTFIFPHPVGKRQGKVKMLGAGVRVVPRSNNLRTGKGCGIVAFSSRRVSPSVSKIGKRCKPVARGGTDVKNGNRGNGKLGKVYVIK